MEFFREYGVATHIYIPIPKRAVVDFAVSADWTPAAGDVKISKDGGAAANVTNLPTAITMGNTAMWDFSLTATEMQAAQVMVTVADSATKAVEDQFFTLGTYGNASARHKVNLNDSVRAGLTALPNAAAEAAGGLYTRGSGAGQINQANNGQIDVNSARTGGTTNTARDIGLQLDATVSSRATQTSVDTVDDFLDTEIADIRNRLPAALVSGRIDASVGAMANDVVTAAAIAPDAIGSSELAASAVTEIQTGLSTLDAAGIRGAVGLASANLDTQLSGINSKTTNLPTDPADASDVAGAFSAVNATLATIAGYLDTEIGAIKAKTDNLPSDPADASDITTRFNTLDTAIDALPTNAELATALGTADDAVLAAIAALNNLSSAGAQAAAAAALAAYGAATGANVTAVPAAMLTAAQATPIHSRVKIINNTTLQGAGTAGDLMRPV